MNIIDIGIVIFLIFGFLIGFKRGFTKELVKALGFILVLVLSYIFKNPLSVILYEHLPFFNIGILKGVEVLNILIYELIAFIICLIVFSLILKVLTLVTAIFEKLLNATIILGIPSKILGGVVGVIHHFIITFVILYVLTLACFDIDFINNSKLKDKIVTKTPILSSLILKGNDVIGEFINLKNEYNDKTISEYEFNLKAIDLFLKYDVISHDNLVKLIDSGKIKSIEIKDLEKYKGE